MPYRRWASVLSQPPCTLRVRQGGHDIPDPTIRQCFEAGKRLFFERYQSLVDQRVFYDNSARSRINFISQIASGANAACAISY